jgi:hypothetical protein
MDPKTRLRELTDEEYCRVALHVIKVKEDDPVVLRVFLIEACIRLAQTHGAVRAGIDPRPTMRKPRPGPRPNG